MEFKKQNKQKENEINNKSRILNTDNTLRLPEGRWVVGMGKTGEGDQEYLIMTSTEQCIELLNITLYT